MSARDPVTGAPRRPVAALCWLLALCACTLPRALCAEDAPATLTLDEARALALRNHPRYAAAQLQTFLAQEVLKETRAGYFPTANGYIDAVGATSEDARILAGGINNPSIYDRTAGGVVVSQLITDFGRTGNLTESAKAQARGAVAGAESTREQVLLNAETSYFAALQAQSILEVARQTVQSRQLVMKQVQALEQNRLKSSLDVSFAQVAVEESDLLVQQAQGDVQSAMASLSTALGFRKGHDFALTDRPAQAAAPAPVENLIDDALRDRPDLQRLRDVREAAKSAASAEKDANYPTVAAIGAAGNAPWHDSHLPPNYAVGGIQMSIPLFAGGSYVARENEARIRAEMADEDLRDAEDNVARDVRTAWVAANTARQRLVTADQLVTHANESFNLAQARYNAGSSSVVELSEAQLSQTGAAITQANARYAILIQDAILRYEVGALK
jgi:outer membrane protein